MGLHSVRVDTMVGVMSSYDSIASRNIRQAIEDKNTNRHAVSRASGISYQTLNRRLAGSGSLTLEQLEGIARALEKEPTELLVVTA